MASSAEQQRETSTPACVANVDQAAAWDGEEGDRWTEHAERYDATTRRHGLHLREAAHISADNHVLDIGCGCGESTREAARLAASGMALGVDLSARMIARAPSAPQISPWCPVPS